MFFIIFTSRRNVESLILTVEKVDRVSCILPFMYLCSMFCAIFFYMLLFCCFSSFLIRFTICSSFGKYLTCLEIFVASNVLKYMLRINISAP